MREGLEGLIDLAWYFSRDVCMYVCMDGWDGWMDGMDILSSLFIYQSPPL